MRNPFTAASLAALVLGLGGIAAAPAAQAQISIGINVGIAPPPLPVEEQPVIPGYGYLWTPGYWSWDPSFNSYYWVPGEWVLPPQVGLYWTPGYWGWNNGAFIFNSGYWGPTVGYYGGVDYGYGYVGRGYYGGEWRGGRLFYNRAVSNIGSRRIATVFSRPVTPVTTSRVSFAGGRGGLNVKPTPAELAAARARHVRATPEQVRQAHAAATNPELRADAVKAKPKIPAGRTLPAKNAAAGPVNPRGPAAAKAVNPGGPMTARGREAMRPSRAPAAAGPARAHENRPVNPAMGPGPTPPVERARRVRPNAEQAVRPAGEPTVSHVERRTGVERTAPERMTPMARPERASPEGAMRARPESRPANGPGREPSAKPGPGARGATSPDDRKRPPPQ
ncbi:MAG TPA: hypothetical protein VGH15_04835 [Caulobacteraceae bacterium]|jgi:hypothetical protein